jgi:hypothetical protein
VNVKKVINPPPDLQWMKGWKEEGDGVWKESGKKGECKEGHQHHPPDLRWMKRRGGIYF